jgi:hypothetical protein
VFDVRRREFITLLGGAAAAWPMMASAQQNERVWRIGYLSATEALGEPQAHSRRLIMEAALARLGYVEGRNLRIERKLLSDQLERVNDAVAELLASQPDLIVAAAAPARHRDRTGWLGYQWLAEKSGKDDPHGPPGRTQSPARRTGRGNTGLGQRLYPLFESWLPG